MAEFIFTSFTPQHELDAAATNEENADAAGKETPANTASPGPRPNPSTASPQPTPQPTPQPIATRPPQPTPQPTEPAAFGFHAAPLPAELLAFYGPTAADDPKNPTPSSPNPHARPFKKRNLAAKELQSIPYADDHPLFKTSKALRFRARHFPRLSDFEQLPAEQRLPLVQYLITSASMGTLRAVGQATGYASLYELRVILESLPQGQALLDEINLPSIESLQDAAFNPASPDPCTTKPTPGACGWTLLDVYKAMHAAAEPMRGSLIWQQNPAFPLLAMSALDTTHGKDSPFMGMSPRAAVDLCLGRKYAPAEELLSALMGELTGVNTLATSPKWNLSDSLKTMTHGTPLDRNFQHFTNWKDSDHISILVARSLPFKSVHEATLTGLLKGGASLHMQKRFQTSKAYCINTLRKYAEFMYRSVERDLAKHVDPDEAARKISLIDTLYQRIQDDRTLDMLYWQAVRSIMTDQAFYYGDDNWELPPSISAQEERVFLSARVTLHAMTRILVMQWLGPYGRADRVQSPMTGRALVAIALLTGVPILGMLKFFTDFAARSGILTCDNIIYTQVYEEVRAISADDLLSLSVILGDAKETHPQMYSHLRSGLEVALETFLLEMETAFEVNHDEDPITVFFSGLSESDMFSTTAGGQRVSVRDTLRSAYHLKSNRQSLAEPPPVEMVRLIFGLDLEETNMNV